MRDTRDVRFFLGSNTKRGFVPLFDKLKKPKKGYRFYILKGGPGSGKSTLMKRVADTLMEQDHFVEFMPCASDPDSLDAIYDHDAEIVIVDGTAPHILDPDYPGAYDMIINMGEAWSGAAIEENKKEIMELSRDISKCHKMATSCIKSAAALLDENRLNADEYLQQKGIRELAEKLAKELDEAEAGEESHRLLSAVTVGKILFFENTIKSLCNNIYSIRDEWGAVSASLLSEIRAIAQRKKIAFTSCYCSIGTPDKIDHILIPSIGLALNCSNSYHSTESKHEIFANELMKPVKNYELESMLENAQKAKDLLGMAARHVARAKDLHDELEKYYISAMDFSRVNVIYQSLMDDILRKIDTGR